MEIELNGHHYRAAKLSVFDQLKVTRRLLPILSGLMGDLKKLYQREIAIEVVLPVITDAVAQLSDSDCDAILYPCLSVVSRQNEKKWVPVFSQGTLMFDDIDMMTLLLIVGHVIGDSLGNFFPAPQGNETAIPPSQA